MRKGIILALAVLATAILGCGEEVLAKEKDKKTVTVANINIFHGIPCAAAGDQTQCRLSQRIDLLFEHLAAIGCPDIVTLQEVLDREDVLSQNPDGSLGMIQGLTSALSLIQAKLSAGEDCGSEYKYVIYSADPAIPLDQRPLFERTDEELILSRYPIVQAEVRLLHSALFVPVPPPDSPPFLRMFLQAFARHVLFVRINHRDVGLLDVFTTHLAASEDFGDNTCHSKESFSFPNAQGTLSTITFDVPCPAECDGAKTVRQCEARQVANFVKELHDDVRTPAFITGDLNTKSHSAVYKEIINADHRRKHRWIDSYLAADNPECNRHTGIGCTAGRDAVRGDLEDPALNVDERIDYIFVVPSAPELESKIQEKGTGLFADKPNPFIENEQCSPSGPICWASDHNGTRANLSCERSADRDFSLASW